MPKMIDMPLSSIGSETGAGDKQLDQFQLKGATVKGEKSASSGQAHQPPKMMSCLVKENLNIDGLALRSDIPEPEPGFGEVKIKVLATAVCGTDKSIFHSSKSEGIRKEMQRYLLPDQSYSPIIVGHEFCGIVESVGTGVADEHWRDASRDLIIEPGDYVTAEMHLACGHCYLCRTGNEHICVNFKVKGLHANGCFAEAVVIPYKNVILLGKGGDTSQISPKIGALMDAFGNAVHTVMEANVAGKTVAILGAGPLGLMATFLCRDFGAARIYLTEAAEVQRRFKLGAEFGADYMFDVSKGSSNLREAIRTQEAAANGVDIVLEMSGSLPAYEDAFQIVRNGGSVILLGIAREPLPRFDIANNVIWKGVTVKGIFGRKMFDTWETMLRLLRSKRSGIQERLEKIICARTFSLEECNEAFELLGKGQEMKLVFSPQATRK